MRKTKFLAGMLTAAMVATMLPVSALAISPVAEKDLDKLPSTETSDRGYPYSDGVVLNKTATIPSSKYGPTEVTLSITGTKSSDVPDETAPMIVEFVVDATSSLFASGNEQADQATADKWVDALIEQFKDKNAHVGMTLFTNEAKEAVKISSETLTEQNASDMKNAVSRTELYAWGAKPENLGTNVQAGIELGTSVLNDFTLQDYPNARKYLVLITDGGAFWWNNANGAKTNSTYQKDQDVVFAQNNMAGERKTLTYKTLADLKNATANMSEAYAASSLSDLVSNIEKYPITDFEKGIYNASKAVDAIPNTINLVTIGYPYYNKDQSCAELTGLANSFLQGNKGTLVQASSATDTSALVRLMSVITSDSKEPASNIPGSMQTVIAAGSTVTDIIGKGSEKNSSTRKYNFDVDTTKEFTFTFNQVSISAKLNAANEISFTQGNKVYATLKYTKDDGSKDNNEEFFTLTINDPITINDKVTLTYTANLIDYSAASGTHTLDVNNQATLQHKTSAGAEHTKLFPVPTYTYTESGGGSSGGSNKPQLNKDDHYAYVVGYPDGTVRPSAHITREEVATIFFRLLTDKSRAAAWTTTNNFPDVASSRWSNNAISTAYKAQIISGYPNGTFRPGGNITRAEFATIAAKFSDQPYKGGETFTDTKGHWAHDYIEIAVQEGWIAGYSDGTFRPDVQITRAEAMTLINAVLSRKPDADHMLDDMIHWPDNPTSAWYYAQVQEATNSHEYQPRSSYDETEVWTKIIPTRDWKALEDPSNNQYLDSSAGDVTK